MNHIEKHIKVQKLLIKNHTNKSLKYLYGRGFTDKIIKRFGIGYNDGIELPNIPIFYDCITIPFYDLKNRIVAYYCRSIDKDSERKHMTSNNEPFLYEKGKMFYNLNNVLHKYYNGKVFVVEGQIDCISMHQAGFKNTIAIIGNQVTNIQCELLYRYFDRIYLVADNDDAGDYTFKFLESSYDEKKRKKLSTSRKKLKKLSLFKIKIRKKGAKDVNDLLVKGIDIKQYFKEIKEKIS